MPLPRNAFADDHRIRALAETLQISLDQANTAFAAYAPRDTAEASMVEQLLILQYNLHQTTRAAREPGLAPTLADRMRRTMIMLNRDLVRLSERLEKRQTQTRGILPQQYWRDQPIEPIGPYEAGLDAGIPVGLDPAAPDPAAPDQVAPDLVAEEPPAPTPARIAITRRFDVDDPRTSTDPLSNLLRMRIGADVDPDQLWAIAQQEAAAIRRDRTQKRVA